MERRPIAIGAGRWSFVGPDNGLFTFVLNAVMLLMTARLGRAFGIDFFNDIRKVGPMANLDKKRTIMENIKRNAAKGHAHFGGIRNEDLRFKTWTRELRRETSAAVIAMRDVSGSMGEFEKYVTRSFYFWMVRFLRSRYSNVEIVFIAHHTEAREVSEEEFFHKGESGGTFISSGYQKALDIIAERYHPSLWNVYAFHCSDGDNFDSDNPAALRAAQELTEVCNLFGYGEIKPLGSRYYESSMLNIFRRLEADNFQTVLIERKELTGAVRPLGPVLPAVERHLQGIRARPARTQPVARGLVALRRRLSRLGLVERANREVRGRAEGVGESAARQASTARSATALFDPPLGGLYRPINAGSVTIASRLTLRATSWSMKKVAATGVGSARPLVSTRMWSNCSLRSSSLPSTLTRSSRTVSGIRDSTDISPGYMVCGKSEAGKLVVLQRAASMACWMFIPNSTQFRKVCRMRIG